MLINCVLCSCSYEKAPWVSEIQDKGDLFYVEQYADLPNSGHSTAQHKQTSQQNGGEVMKDKRLTGNKLFGHIRRMKKTKKTSDIINAKDNYDNQDRDTANVERGKKLEVKLRVNPPRIGPYKRDDLESVMGIIPLKSLAANDRDELSYGQEYGRDSRIVIAGFTPTGPAIASHQLEIGEYHTFIFVKGLRTETKKTETKNTKTRNDKNQEFLPQFLSFFSDFGHFQFRSIHIPHRNTQEIYAIQSLRGRHYDARFSEGYTL